ncbi:hypothetical protein BDP27DRAFT_1344453 [Rhodocollybia butyracea]|uniref:Shugoshin C-terminal domain-containing protein n=1 Tax=Rhodocollybia butyracea TaxID=206335 RepID=A0A9P5TYB5_9AGAR|nr:hypothetical protein BDP27DRAFT_1344453 [Rhodocollybia butyracea]
MSRRESRVSMSARQNDALFEFENFKKKFLLANKHITKLNSTLSVRIEELNAQISTLYTENLRLRASEINLAAQLKREREKSRKVIAETEAAALGLTKHLGSLRQAFSITDETPSSSPTPARATQRPLPPSDSPNPLVYPRLSRAPTIPLIYEDDEPSDPTEDEDEAIDKVPSPRRKAKRPSTSRLPLLSRTISPPPAAPQVDFSAMSTSGSFKRKPLRRQSGLLVRQGSPVVGSIEAEEEDDVALVAEEPEPEAVPVVKKEKRKVPKEKGKEKEHGVSLRKKLRDEMGDEGKKLKLADVTNSPRSRPAQPVESVVSEVELETAPYRREFLSSSPPRSSSSSRSSPSNYLPALQPTSSSLQIPANPPTDDPDPQSESAAAGGRERRMRRSVNYAEPKLNTKMRKPDSEPGGSSRKRKSASAVMSIRSEECIGATAGHEVDMDRDDDTDAGPRSSLEGPSQPLSGAKDPSQLPLPASRPGSSADVAYPNPASSSLPLRRAKSRPHIYADDDVSSESDGADTEFVPSGGAGKGGAWVNMERKKGGKRTAPNKYDDESGRRHSMAV